MNFLQNTFIYEWQNFLWNVVYPSTMTLNQVLSWGSQSCIPACRLQRRVHSANGYKINLIARRRLLTGESIHLRENGINNLQLLSSLKIFTQIKLELTFLLTITAWGFSSVETWCRKEIWSPVTLNTFVQIFKSCCIDVLFCEYNIYWFLVCF